MELRTQSKFNELATEWEVKVAELRTKEVAELNAGQDHKAHITGMTADTLEICIDQLRQTITDLRRVQNHETNMINMINNLTK